MNIYQYKFAPKYAEVLIAGFVCLATSALFLAIGWTHGAIGASRGDDWSHYRIAYQLATNGSFEMDSWSSSMLIGHVLLGWPIIQIFGPNIAPLQVAVSILGGFGLLASYVLVRSFLPTRWAALSI